MHWATFLSSGWWPNNRQVRYLMRGINGEKLGLKCLNVGKILTIQSLCGVECKLYLKSKTQGGRDYEKCHWRNPFWYVVCKMMTIFINRIWCVKVDPFVGNWSKRRQTETSTTKTSTNRNTDVPKCRQTKTKAATNQNVDIPKHQQTKASTERNVDRPKHRQTKTSTNQTKPKRRNTKTSTDQKRWHTKRRQTETSTVQFSKLYSRVFVFIILGMYYIYIHTYVWLVGCTLCISTHNFIIIGGHSTYQYQQN